MKKSSIILVVLTLVLWLLMYACDGADSGKVKGTTQGVDLTTTQNITTAAETTTHTAAASTQAPASGSGTLSPSDNSGTSATR